MHASLLPRSERVVYLMHRVVMYNRLLQVGWLRVMSRRRLVKTMLY